MIWLLVYYFIVAEVMLFGSGLWQKAPYHVLVSGPEGISYHSPTYVYTFNRMVEMHEVHNTRADYGIKIRQR